MTKHLCETHGLAMTYRDWLNTYACDKCMIESCQECGTEYNKVLGNDEVAVKKHKIDAIIEYIRADKMVSLSEILSMVKGLI